jgi:hypothetical protein
MTPLGWTYLAAGGLVALLGSLTAPRGHHLAGALLIGFGLGFIAATLTIWHVGRRQIRARQSLTASENAS